uniref:Putative ribosomal protein s12 methylthiotransferase rimo n=1 Tax=Panstrongylus lignarius TaxID=156445 RepID=A0A224XK66_9HEMI
MATIISLTVLASFASGFVCLLVVGIKWASAVKRDLVAEGNSINGSRIICARCGVSFFDNPQLGLKDVLCAGCKRPVCSACALRYPHLWLCTACIKSRDGVMELGNLHLKDLRLRFPVIDLPTKRYGKRENEVKDLIEMLVQNILGISFENIKINPLSNDITYLEFMDKYEGVLALTLLRLKISIQLIIDGVASVEDDNPSSIELQIRGLIQEIAEDATCIDLTKMSDMRSITKCNIASKTYEDILSIAILNKIVENVALLTKSGSKARAILPRELQSDISLDQFRSEVDQDSPKWSFTLLEQNYSKRSDLRANSQTERHQPANLKLEAKIRELRTYTSNKTYWNKYKVSLPDLGCDLPQENNSELKASRWEENWLFRRKKSEVICRPTSNYKTRTFVSMFVPSPNSYMSPHIGEECIEDVSDLSDLSDSEVERLIQI